MQTGKLNVLLDGFWGSSGKGKMAAFLADKFSVTKASSSNFPNAGHCVGGCTYIYTDVGIRQIEDVVKEARAGTNVVNMNGEMENVSHFVPDGVRVVNTIKLVNGVVIDCTDSHKFYVWDSEKCDFVWIRSMDLDPSTNFFLFPKRVVLHERDLLDKSWHSQDKPNKKQISLPVSEESFAEYLGLLVGDGYYAKRTRVDIAFHTSQLDVMTKIQAMYSEMGIDNQYISQVGNKDCVVLSTSQCSGLMELFEHVGLEIATKDKKRTPSRVMASKPSVMGAYLRGLFDADGSVKTDRVTLSNCSESVIRDAQVILHALGISSFVTSYDDRRTDSPRMTQYCLSVSGTRNLSVFQERVGLLSKRKKELLNVLVESRQDLGPLIKINADTRVVSRQGGFRTESDSMRVSTIEHLSTLGILFGPITVVARDYHVIGIDSIGFATKEIEVFDLTVPGTHSYLANGCIAHNTAQFEDGTKFVAKAIPTAAILKKVKGTGMQCWLSPGSGFSWDRLVAEWDEAGRPRIFVHGRASIVSEEHARRERQGSDSTKHIASTMQGSGTAISDKVLRRPDCLLAINDEEAMFDALQGMGAGDYVSILAPESFRKMTWEAIESGHTWLHEGSQGFALSIDHGSHFPFCTSRNCTLQSAMDHMAVPPALVGDVYLNLRTYPIRVGNVVEDGKQVGFSGDFYPDCEELTWEQVAERSGMPSDEAHRLAERERTTVTKRIRRVCTFTFDGLEQAVKTNGATKLCLNFVQYLDWKDNGLRGGPEAFKKLSKATRTLIDQIEEESGVKVVLIGTGADHEDMISLL